MYIRGMCSQVWDVILSWSPAAPYFLFDITGKSIIYEVSCVNGMELMPVSGSFEWLL